jgi:hypothetical protein
MGSLQTNRDEYANYYTAPRSVRRILAQPYAISADGRYLLMARTSAATPTEISKHGRIPQCLQGDSHRGNFGWYCGRIVMHDYAFKTGRYDLASLERPMYVE